MSTKNPQPRDELVRAISNNLNTFSVPEHIEALFIDTAADLILGGVDRIRVEAALSRAWVRMQVAQRGAVATAELLRDFADRIERPALNSQKSTQPN
jgi:hypothetical protein